MNKKIELKKLVDEMDEQFTFEEKYNDSELAYKYLSNYLRLFEKISPENTFTARNFYCDYIRYLISIREALVKKEYGVACHELATLFYLDPVYEIRVHRHLVNLLNEFIQLPRK